MGRYERDKGARVEREIATTFRRFGFGARRNPHQSAAVEDGRDLEVWVPCGDHEDQDRIPCEKCRPVEMCVQVKAGKRPSPWKSLEEATRAADSTERPWGIVRKDKEPPLVMMYLEDLLIMARVYEEAVR